MGVRFVQHLLRTDPVVRGMLEFSAVAYGRLVMSGSRGSIAGLSGWDQPNIALGYSGYPTDTYAAHINGQNGETILFDRPLTEAERTELFAMDSWEWDRFGGRTLAFAAVGT